MEKVIEIQSLDKEKIEELKKVLENYQIKEIKNEIKDENKIEIKFDKERKKLNENFKFKVELIRNKYYRQLLSLVNTTVKKYIIEKNGKLTMLDILKDGMELRNIYINASNYMNMLKMSLINYIGTYNFDNFFELTRDEMIQVRKYKIGINNKINDKGAILDALGMYCYYNEELFRVLETNIAKGDERLEKIKECNKFILICPELIQEFCIKRFDDFKKCGIRDCFELNSIIFDKVLAHEIGHGVFDYLYDGEDEKRANYFASLTFDGTFDEIIKAHTDIQDREYKNPYLIDDEISTITEKVYNI